MLQVLSYICLVIVIILLVIIISVVMFVKTTNRIANKMLLKRENYYYADMRTTDLEMAHILKSKLIVIFKRQGLNSLDYGFVMKGNMIGVYATNLQAGIEMKRIIDIFIEQNRENIKSSITSL